MRAALLPAALLLLAPLAAGCAGRRESLRAFEEGRETAFFREQEVLARSAPPRVPPPPQAPAAASLEDLRARRALRVEERGEHDGLLDLADPATRAAFDAGADAARTEALLARAPLELAAVRALAAARSPAVRGAREEWRAAVEGIGQAAWLEEVAGSFRSLAGDPGTRAGGAAAPDYPWPSATALRGEMADLEGARSRERVREAVAEAVAGASEAFAGVWAAGERVRILRELLPAHHALDEVASARYAAGGDGLSAVLDAASEVRRMETDLAAARNDRDAARARLNAILDRPGDAPLPDLAPPPLPAALPPAAVLAALSPSAPGPAMAERTLEIARVGIRMAELAGRAPPGEARVGVEAAFLGELRLRAAAAESALAAARRGAEAAARDAWGAADTALRTLRAEEGTSVPLAEQALEVAVRAFESGTGDYAALVRAREESARARSAALDARVEAIRGIAAATRATGTAIGETTR